MHASVLAWIHDEVLAHGLAGRATLEVGSLDVNGSVRPLLGGPYTGVDMRPGPGVDVVARASELPFADGAFDVVVSTEMLEHDPEPWRSLPEMGRVLAPDGHLLITTRGNGFPQHAHPDDFWRFMPSAGPVLAELAGCRPLIVRDDPEYPGIFIHAVRNAPALAGGLTRR